MCGYNTFLLIIRRFLVKRVFYQQFVETVKMRKFTTATGIVSVIVHVSTDLIKTGSIEME